MGRDREAAAEGIRVVEVGSAACGARYCDNTVTNSKYTLVTFLPLNFLEQFSRPLNQYFLLIALLQFISIIAPVNPLSTILPLLLAFTLTAVKEGYDDKKRHALDAVFNNRMYDVIQHGELVQKRSRDIRVGDVVKVMQNSEIPCDLFLLKSSDPDGVAYIRTDNLDGEIDLKPRACVPVLAACDVFSVQGKLSCDPPNPRIYHFNSVLEVGGERHSVTTQQLLLQSCFLQNTEYVYGVAVYTGGDTKCGRNKESPPIKWATVDKEISRYSVRVFIFQLAIAFVMGLIGVIELAKYGDDAWYLGFHKVSAIHYIATPMRFFLLTSVMIPISFKVIIDISKYYISLAIGWDASMYDPNIDAEAGGTPAVANNTAIAEDLGQIESVLTDKTGTLTDNIMEFVACSLGGQTCGGSKTGSAHFDPTVSVFSDSANAEERFSARTDPAYTQFGLSLALCHTVSIETNADGTTRYAAASPDEEALVKAAVKMGFSLRHRTKNVTTIARTGTTGATEEHEILHVMEFDSDRKMMSILLRNRGTGVVTLYTKGADERMLPLVRGRSTDKEVETLEAHLRTFASAGLRTLVLGYRDVPADEYQAWSKKIEAAAVQPGDAREVALQKAYEEIELDLTVSGATAIEDKLQDGVPDTIATLRRANIRFWMLTGDKFETAKQISRSCGLWAEGEELLPLQLGPAASMSEDQLLSKLYHDLTAAAAAVAARKRPPAAGERDPGARVLSPYGTFAPVVHGEASYAELPSQAHGPANQSTSSSTSSVSLKDFSEVTNRKPTASSSSDRSDTISGSGLACAGHVLIVEGRAVQLLLDTYYEQFRALCNSVNSVVCCRVTPGQKASLTAMAKSGETPHPDFTGNARNSQEDALARLGDFQSLEGAGKRACPGAALPGCCKRGPKAAPPRRVLSIGDGGNDVSMIQEATIGVGIVGKEGRQASRAADYSIARFRFLKPLLLVHGQYSYQRSCYIAQYCFYKSMLLAFIQIIFNWFATFSGVSYWNSLLLTAWNGAFTLPAPFLYVLDRCAPRERLMESPELYKAAQSGEALTGDTFAMCLLLGVFHGMTSLLVTLIVFNGDSVSHAGDPMDFNSIFTVTYTALIMIQAWIVVLDSHTLTVPNLLGIFLMPPFYLAFVAAYGAQKWSDYYGVGTRLFNDPAVWLTVIVITVALFAPYMFVKSYYLNYNPTPMQLAYLRGAGHPTLTSHGKPVYHNVQSAEAATVLHLDEVGTGDVPWREPDRSTV
ncbi:putative phospholipid-transporting ATPase 8 [Diplonema papillatum]|nr:putative phospholipid-transporting ATPase 8 [Diplonema papillatum]